jgi:lipopolysaccharide/colanic/teichoic acid biosynthesis glycosyltransferase
MYPLKRAIDIVLASIALIVLSPLMVILAILVRLDSPGPAIFRQLRVGRDMRTFSLLKFRSMKHRVSGNGVTSSNDPRITRLGAWLRRAKLDELPQLCNVLRGDMSIVGPRPEIPVFVNLFRSEFAEILRIRPGITDPASIKYRSEEDILGAYAEPMEHYTNVILPAKIQLSKDYVRSASIRTDFNLIGKTLAALFRRAS